MLNPTKTQCMLVGRSKTELPLHPKLHVNGAVLSAGDSFKILGVIFDKKLTFEKHLRGIAASVLQKIGILRRFYRLFGNESVSLKCYNARNVVLQ